MIYRYGMEVELGDQVEVDEDGFEPEEATVISIGKKGTIRIEYANRNIKPGKVWTSPAHCELIARG